MKQHLHKTILISLICLLTFPFTAKSESIESSFRLQSTEDSVIATLPFVENFDNTPGGSRDNGILPLQWKGSYTNSAYKPHVGTQISLTSDKFVSAFGALNFGNPLTSGTNIVILPALQGLSAKNLELNFMAKMETSSANNTFVIGVMTNPNDTATFVPVRTVTPLSTTWKNFSIPLTDYAGNGNYIALMWKNATTSLLLDDLYIDLATTCPIPTSVKIDNVSTTTIDFSWINDTSNYWEAVCARPGVAPDWSQAVPTHNKFAVISGLSPATQYVLYLRTICVDNSFPVTATFTTACGTITEEMLPYKESFDTYGTNNDFPFCWFRKAAYLTDVSIGTTHSSAPGGLKLYAGSSSLVYAITGPFDMDISQIQIDFKARFTEINYGLVIGVMSHPDSINTFIPVDTVFAEKRITYSDFTVFLNQYDGEGKYIAFRNGGFVPTATIHIDDVVIKSMGSCIMPDQLLVTDVLDNNATLTWQENGKATTWEIACGPVGFNPDNDEGYIWSANTNPATILPLIENTVYDVYVRAYCSPGNESEWSPKQTFQTPQIPAEIPYECNFEDEGENEKWILINGTQTNQWHINTAVNNTVGGGKSLYISNDNGATHAYNDGTSFVYALRTINIATAGKFEIFFSWWANGEKDSDIARAFLVPTTTKIEAGTTNGMGSSSNTPPNDWIDIGGGNLELNNQWVSRTVEFEVEKPMTYNLVFFWKNNASSGSQAPAAIDNISIRPATCKTPDNLTLLDVSDSQATVAWQERATAFEWEVQYGLAGFLIGEGMTEFATDTMFTILGLTSNFTPHNVYVRALCGVDGNSNWVGPLSFNTTQLPVSLPYLCDFEDDAENETWGLLNGTQTNQWHINTAVNNTPDGSKSLYISNNNGETHGYSNVSSCVYALKSFELLDTGTYELTFDWLSNGDKNYDVTRVFLVPFEVNIEAGNHFGMTGSISDTPDGWIDLSDGNLQLNNVWSTKRIEFTLATPGAYKLVFFWKNDNLYNYPFPGAIDNIGFRFQTCPYPSYVTTSDITSSEATVYWLESGSAAAWEIEYGQAGFALGTGTSDYIHTISTNYKMTGLMSSTNYDVYIRAICGVEDTSWWANKITFRTLCPADATLELPYFENFDHHDNGVPIPTYQKDVIPYCWTVSKTGNAESLPYIANWGDDNARSLPYTLDFGYTPNGYSTAILPAIHDSISMTNIQISFWGKSKTGSNGNFYVGVMNDPNVDASFTVIASFNTPVLYQKNTTTLIDYTGTGRYIAFRWANGTNNSYTMDNLEVTINENSCPAPTSVVVSDITENFARLTWSAGNNATSWTVEYKKVSEIEYSTPMSTNSPHFSLSHLALNTDYDVRIRTICSDTTFSAGATTQFKTLIAKRYTINATAGANGSIDPSGQVLVFEGYNQTFTFTPDNGYEIEEIKVNDVAVPMNTSYTFGDVRENATISVSFKESDTIVIIATAGEHGTINPIGEIKVAKGTSQTFTFTPDPNYAVDSILVDNILVATDTSSYTIENVQANMTIHITFKQQDAISQYQLDQSVLIYPNPVSEQLKVKLSMPFEQLEITNLLGQVIHTDNVNGNEIEINVGDYHSGVYFIRLSGKRGVTAKKFVKE